MNLLILLCILNIQEVSWCFTNVFESQIVLFSKKFCTSSLVSTIKQAKLFEKPVLFLRVRHSPISEKYESAKQTLLQPREPACSELACFIHFPFLFRNLSCVSHCHINIF